MADEICVPDEAAFDDQLVVGVSLLAGFALQREIVHDSAAVPPGALRIGGDSPGGLVKAAGVPVARTVDLFARAEKVFVASTVSDTDGTYAFAGLSTRLYDVVIRGNSGERDVIVPGVTPI